MVLWTFITEQRLTLYSDFQNGTSEFAVILLSITAGYFVYDTMHMLTYKLHLKAKSIILHHFAIIACILKALSGNSCIPYVIFPLLSEVNSVFLHLRKLLSMINLDVVSLTYQGVWKMLWVTFFWFRVIPCLFITVKAWEDKHFKNPAYFLIGFGGILTINVMNFFLWKELKKVQNTENAIIRKKHL